MSHRRMIDWPYWALDLGIAVGVTVALCSWFALMWWLS